MTVDAIRKQFYAVPITETSAPSRMRVRLHRGGFEDSCSTIQEIDATFDALQLYMGSAEIRIEPYDFDEREPWNADTFIVTSAECVAYCDKFPTHGTEPSVAPTLGTDPKGQAGATKCPLWLIPPEPMEEAAWVHALGAKKYGPWNWRKNKVSASTYISAILRHLNAWRNGEDKDPESGRSHLAHIVASCFILMDAALFGNLVDDRSKKV